VSSEELHAAASRIADAGLTAAVRFGVVCIVVLAVIDGFALAGAAPQGGRPFVAAAWHFAIGVGGAVGFTRLAVRIRHLGGIR